MSYTIEILNHALLPDRAQALDARSHFKTLADAMAAITEAKVCSAENADKYENIGVKFYYFGQVIDTETGLYQVCTANQFYPTNISCSFSLIFNDGNWTATWNNTDYFNAGSKKIELINSKWTLSIRDKNNICNINFIFTSNELVTNTTILKTCSSINYSNQCFLRPVSGAASSGGSSLSIDAQAPINYNQATGALSLSIGSGLNISNNSLALKIDNTSPLTTNTNGLTLSYGNTLEVVNNKLEVKGTHTTLDLNDSTDDIKVGNYVYTKIGG